MDCKWLGPVVIDNIQKLSQFDVFFANKVYTVNYRNISPLNFALEDTECRGLGYD